MAQSFSDIAELIGKTKRRYYTHLLVESVVKLLILIILFFFLFLLLDTMFYLSALARGISLGVFCLYLGGFLSYFAVKVLARKITSEQICLLAQKHNPALKDSLINAWQLFEKGKKGEISGVSFELMDAYIKSVAGAILNEDISSAVSLKHLKRMFVSAFCVLTVFLCLYNIPPYIMKYAVLRLFDPSLDVVSSLGSIKLQGVPEIGDLKVKVIYPAYTGMPIKIFEEGGNAEALKNSTLEISGVTNKSVVAAYLEGKEGEKKIRLPMNTSDPLHPSVRFVIKDNLEYYIVLTDRANLENAEKIKHRIKIVKDEKPKINMVFPSEELSVLPGSTVNILFEYLDDFGVNEVNLVIENKGAEEKRRIFKDNANKKTGSGNYELEIASCKVQLGGELFIYLEAFDNDIIDGPKRGVSQKVRLFLPGLEDYLKEADPMDMEQFLELERKMSELNSKSEDFEKQLKKYAEQNDPDMARMLGDLEMLQDDLSSAEIACPRGPDGFLAHVGHAMLKYPCSAFWAAAER